MVMSARHDHDARGVPPIGMMMVVMVVMMSRPTPITIWASWMFGSAGWDGADSSMACSSAAAFGMGSSRSAKEFARKTSFGAGAGVGAA